MYTIKVDKRLGLVEANLGGMMTTEEVATYVADLKRAFIEHRLHSYAMVIDVSSCPIQSQDMIQAMGQHMATMPKARALAIVTGSSLARMQVRRLFTQPYARITANVCEGRSWVLYGTEPVTH
ncbi:MAG: hypothetical protein EOO77_35380 [Oxalobacteraceae bacterium]|nr:MAG: hypothetical protein EOO77_35380 [Oxalobacteraceae bacterium]